MSSAVVVVVVVQFWGRVCVFCFFKGCWQMTQPAVFFFGCRGLAGGAGP